ncbi:MAG: hypothetical protein D6778_05900 [Nitrospirae bacterium]|nr:MAG: hypothetical protein D6778_05900 [Nitrospirota bacterium]
MLKYLKITMEVSMKVLKGLVVFAMVFSLAAQAEALTKKEAHEALKQFVPPKAKLKILYVKKSPIKGIWEVAVETEGNKNIVYLDSKKRYLILGQILDIAKRQNLTRAHLEDLRRVDVSKIPLDDAVVYGPRDAKKWVVVFSDPD